MCRRLTLDEAMAAIRAKCIDCCGGSRKEAIACKTDCPLQKVRQMIPEKPEKQLPGQLSFFPGKETA